MTNNYELSDLGIRVFYVLNQRLPKERNGIPPFFHKHGVFEMHILLENGCELQTEANRFQINAGQFVLIAPGAYHRFSSKTSHGSRYCLNFELSNRFATTAQKLLQHSQENPVWVGDGKTMLDVVRRLQTESDQEQVFADEIRYMLNRILILDLLREIELHPSVERVTKSSLEEDRNLLIDNFLNFNYHLSAGEESLAEFLKLSRRQLSRILQKQYGKSYREKVAEIRCEVASDFLLHSDMSVREIAEQMGYSTPSNFIAFFRKEKGVTPAQYRRDYRKM